MNLNILLFLSRVWHIIEPLYDNLPKLCIFFFFFLANLKLCILNEVKDQIKICFM